MTKLLKIMAKVVEKKNYLIIWSMYNRTATMQEKFTYNLAAINEHALFDYINDNHPTMDILAIYEVSKEVSFDVKTTTHYKYQRK